MNSHRLRYALKIQQRIFFSTIPVRILAEFENIAKSAVQSLTHPLSSSLVQSASSSSSSSSSLLSHPLGGMVRSVLAKAIDAKTIEIIIEIAAPFPTSIHTRSLLAASDAAANDALAKATVSIAPNINSRAKSIVVPAIHCSPNNALIAKAGPGLSRVGSVVAVSSCKGGVGKSTVAVNLAYALRGLGSRVGILDTDVHGPSLPTMVSPLSLAVTQQPPISTNSSSSKSGSGSSGMINPLTYENVSLMSYGYVARRNDKGERGGAAMRGPMVSQVVQQLLGMTDWGDLDHLIVDMPPGTGDIHITLGQSVPISGAVIVTTPQNLAVVDVIKGLELFNALKVPTLAVVLNMAHFDAPDTGKRYFPFGEGGLERIYNVMERFNIDKSRLFTLPIETSLSVAGDSGVPEVVSNPNSKTSTIYARLALAVASGVDEQLFKQQSANRMNTNTSTGNTSSTIKGGDAISVRHDIKNGKLYLRILDEFGAKELLLDIATVRKACRCAACVDEMTGKQRLDISRVKPDIHVKSIKEQGNYAVQITFSDGHASGVFSYEQLRKLFIHQ